MFPRVSRTLQIVLAASLVWSASAATPARADEPTAGQSNSTPPAEAKTEAPGLRRLSPKDPVWLDAANKRVVLIGEVCLREGMMEMFACLKNTKEHESIVAVPAEAYIVHAGLVAVGAEPGHPARFRPTYESATGTVVEIRLYWSDADGKRHEANAQQWLKNLRTNKNLDQPWVFGGSGFWTDPTSGQRHYQAEDGDFICISNFASAMLDLPIESSQSNSSLLFEAITDRIPPKGTKLSMALVPHLKGLADERGGDPKVDLDDTVGK